MRNFMVQISEMLRDWVYEYMQRRAMPEWSFDVADFTMRSMVLLILSIVLYFIFKKILLYSIVRLIKKSKSTYDDFFVARKVFHRLAHMAPALVIYFFDDGFYEPYPLFFGFIVKASVLYIIVVLFWTFQAFLKALEDIYNTLSFASERPIRGYMQLVHLLFILVGILWGISIVFDVQVTKIFAGMGALAAVLLLVFKDTILGFVAGIQLSANKMLKVGDWIEMPSHNADGTVLEVTLNTVKVQNWDRTITTIPTYALVSSPFMNWRGMEESGGRRIKRSINIDMQSVTFCTPEMIEKFKKIQHLKEYIEKRQQEISEYNDLHGVDETVLVNGRRMTNLGVFRKYIENYLSRNPKINMNMTFLVRHLQPTEKGIPLEIYVFSADQRWANYEGIQADIFDHILAVIPEFGLRVFQLPSGSDLQKLALVR